MAKLRVREIAEKRGYNLTQLQLDTRVNMGVTGRYWHNKVRAVSLDILERLAGVLQVTVSDLIDNETAGEADVMPLPRYLYVLFEVLQSDKRFVPLPLAEFEARILPLLPHAHTMTREKFIAEVARACFVLADVEDEIPALVREGRARRAAEKAKNAPVWLSADMVRDLDERKRREAQAPHGGEQRETDPVQHGIEIQAVRQAERQTGK